MIVNNQAFISISQEMNVPWYLWFLQFSYFWLNSLRLVNISSHRNCSSFKYQQQFNHIQAEHTHSSSLTITTTTTRRRRKPTLYPFVPFFFIYCFHRLLFCSVSYLFINNNFTTKLLTVLLCRLQFSLSPTQFDSIRFMRAFFCLTLFIRSMDGRHYWFVFLPRYIPIKKWSCSLFPQ